MLWSLSNSLCRKQISALTQFWQWVRYTKVLDIILNNLNTNFKGILCLVDLCWRRIDAERKSLRHSDGAQAFEVTHNKAAEVGDHGN